MKSHRFLSHCLSTPWAMEPTAMSLYAAILARAYGVRDGIEIEAAAIQAPLAAAPTRSSGGRAGSIAVIQVFGAIVQRASQIGMCESGVGADDIGRALNAAMADETIGQVLLEFDTPGGSVFGVGELADQIRSQRAVKPIIGLSNSLAASAGYWLLSQCSEAYCTPGGMVGSIGVYTAHQDISKALDEAGVKITLISAGKYKTEGSPFTPLEDDARASVQGSVDDYYSMFTAAVSKGRNIPIAQVRDGMGQGRVLGADQALSEYMIDGVATFADVVKKMQRSAKTTRGSSAEVANGLEIAADATSAQAAEPASDQLARQNAARRREIELLAL